MALWTLLVFYKPREETNLSTLLTSCFRTGVGGFTVFVLHIYMPSIFSLFISWQAPRLIHVLAVVSIEMINDKSDGDGISVVH